MAFKFNPFTGTLDIAGTSSGGTGGTIGGTVTGGTPKYVLYVDGSGNLAQDVTGKIGYVDDVNHRFGIGTTSPGSPLDIQSATGTIHVQSTTGTNLAYTKYENTGGYLLTGREGSVTGGLAVGSTPYFGVMNVNGAYGLQFGTNNTVRATIDSVGNVGIRTISPGTTLDVNGEIRTNTGLIGDDTNGLRFFGALADDTADAPMVVIPTTGLVGIGTLAPIMKLHVAGSGQNTTALSDAGGFYSSLLLDQNSSVTTGSGGSILFGADGHQFAAIKGYLTNGAAHYTGDLAFCTRGATTDATLTEWMRILVNGNVGIGTTTPAHKLDVNGSVNISSGNAYKYNAFDVAKAQTALSNYYFGDASGNFTGTGAQNTGVGANSLHALTTGQVNTALGYDALFSTSTGSSNVANGYACLFTTTTGSLNTACGYEALFTNLVGNTNTAYGALASFATTASSTTAIGYAALQNNTTGVNTAVGAASMLANTTGSLNTAVGQDSLAANTTGSNNTAVGYFTLVNNISGTDLTAIGLEAGYSNTTGNNNTFLGEGAGFYCTTGVANTQVGFLSGFYNITGDYNVTIGDGAGFGVSTNSYSSNTIIGTSAGFAITTSSNNVLIGTSTGSALTSGGLNILVGYNAGVNLTTGSSNIILGYNINAVSASSANTLNIGNLIFGTGIDGTGGSLSTGNIGIAVQTPLNRFHVGLTTGQTALFGGTAFGVTNNRFTGISLGYGEPGAYQKTAIVQKQIGDGAARGTLLFLNNGTNDNSNAALADARMAITYDGLVGIGTSTPAYLLTLNGTFAILEGGSSPTKYSTFSGGDQAIDLNYTLPVAYPVSNGMVLTSTTAGVWSWVAPSVTWDAIGNPAGNLALTMAARTSTFTYNNSTGSADLWTMTDSTTNSSATGYLFRLTTTTGSTLKPFRIIAAGSEAITVNASAQVGIGTASPTTTLMVQGVTTFQNGTTGADSIINITPVASSGPTQINMVQGSINVRTVDPKGMLYLDSISGHVGIMTDGPNTSSRGVQVNSNRLQFGSDTGADYTITNNTNKNFELITPHYTTTNYISVLKCDGLTSTNVLALGGGNASFYAATEIGFYGAANNTTGTGTKVAKIIGTASGYTRTLVGTTSGGTITYAAVGGTIFDHFVDAGNTTTTETDLYTDSIPANTFATNGDKIKAEYHGIFVQHATATRELKVYFAGSVIWDSSAGTTNSAGYEWDVTVLLTRVSSTVVRCSVTLANSFLNISFDYSTYTELTGLTLTGANVLKITGQAGSTGAASSDIVAKQGNVMYFPAA